MPRTASKSSSTLPLPLVRKYVRDDCKDYTPEQVALSIGSFVNDPPSNAFQRRFLAELWTLLREKKGWKE